MDIVNLKLLAAAISLLALLAAGPEAERPMTSLQPRLSNNKVRSKLADSADTAAGWVKSPANPVLGGDLGTCFDVSVVKQGNRFRMWFSWRPKASIGYTESEDGIHWISPQVVLGPNAASGWEDDINRPCVLRRPGGYLMWYTGQARGQSWIGCAASKDGLRWTRLSAAPALSASAAWEKVAVMCPDVLWSRKLRLYRMWYSAGDQYEPNAIGYATSPDGLHWTKDDAANPVFRPDPSQAWELHKVTACCVVPYRGWFYLFYIGFADENTARIGLARSRDGVSGWRRLPQNPFIRPGRSPDAWDHDAVYKPCVVRNGSGWMLFYNGRRGGFEQIGMAAHPGLRIWPTRP